MPVRKPAAGNLGNTLEMSGEWGPTPWHTQPPWLTSLNESDEELCQSSVGCLLCHKEAAEGQA